MIDKNLALALCIACSYLLGNISPSILIGKAHGIDIKKEGSGNAGTTNALRVLGKKAALATLVIDIGKGACAVLIGKFAENYYVQQGDSSFTVIFPMACMIAVFCGHVWPVFFGFKGGKGVATAFGAVVTFSPALGFSLLGIVALVVLITRRVSAGSVCAATAAPLLTYFIYPQAIWGVCLLALIVVIKHRSNIKRLIKGEEPKLSFSKK